MSKNLEIFCTIGPSTLNKKFLRFASDKIDLVRINLSHVTPNKIEHYIKFIKKNTTVPICIDTEGAQIRTKIKIKKRLKINSIYKFFRNKNNYLYPNEVFDKLKKNDLLSIGFDDLKVKIIKKTREYFLVKILKSGLIETNKGVVILNRNLKLNYLTNNDNISIKIAQSLDVRCYALSFTNNHLDVLNFKKKLPNARHIFKLESSAALRNYKKIIKFGKEFLIDRGDLSKETSIYKIPFNQRKITNEVKKRKKRVYIATNLLETMIEKPYPTRAEINDIYSCLEIGANGLVLAAETAIGSHPEECVNYINKMISEFKKNTKLLI